MSDNLHNQPPNEQEPVPSGETAQESEIALAVDTGEFAVDAQEVDELLRKYDKGSNFRILSGYKAKVVSLLLLCFSLFQLYTAIFGTLEPLIQRSIHIAFGLSAVFLLYPISRRLNKTKLHFYDVILALVVASCCLYVVVNFQAIARRMGRVTDLDVIVGVIVVLLVLEAARRVIGLPMVVISCLFLAYALFGSYIPGALGHRGVELKYLIQHLWYTTEGIMGMPIQVSSTFIFMFLLFGAYLERTGMGEFFIDLANSVAGSAPGGPAKVAVISSACMGTLSGSSVANVVGTGSFTIPMMKRLGYKPEFAGAVEATASTGGQLMPPIMGAAAFILAEMTGTPYSTVIVAAIIPVLLYYFGVFAGVHYEAKKLGLKGLPKDQIPKVGHIMRTRGQLIIPIIVVIYLLVNGWSPIFAALGAIASTIVCSAFRKDTRLSPRQLVEGLIAGAQTALTVVSACACAGIITGVVTKTGLGLKMGAALVGIANGNLYLTLIFTMITSLILGIGVPTTANYVITSTIAAPAILLILDPATGEAVVPLLAAHLFVFYFGIIADVTPPVCLAAVAASGVAKSEPMRTGIQATRLAVAAFLIPYIFVTSPELLMINATFLNVAPKLLSAAVGVLCLATGLTGFFRVTMHWWERILVLAAGLCLVSTSLMTDVVGYGIAALIFVYQMIRFKGGKGLATA